MRLPGRVNNFGLSSGSQDSKLLSLSNQTLNTSGGNTTQIIYSLEAVMSVIEAAITIYLFQKFHLGILEVFSKKNGCNTAA